MISGSVDTLAEAEALYSRVVLDPARYTAEAVEALARARVAGQVEVLTVALRACAWARHAVLDNAGAKRLLDEGVRIAERHGLALRLGDLLVTRAVALLELGHPAAAGRDLRRAEPLVAPDRRPELLMQRAIIDHNAGRAASAAVLYRRVLADPACPPVVWVKAANNLSVAQTQLGDPAGALDYLDRAVELAAEMPVPLAVLTNSQAWSSFHAGRIIESLRRFEEAGRLYAAAGLSLGEHYVDYADVLVDLRLLDEAAAVAQAAVVDFEKHGARLMAAEARLRSARLALALGDVALARTEAESAVRDLRLQRRTAWVARATVAAVAAAIATDGYSDDALRRLRRAALTLQRLGLRADAVEAHLAAGRAALARGRMPLAREHLTAAQDRSGRSVLVRLRGRLAAALLAEATGSPGSAVRHCREGLADLARHRAALPSVELRVLAAGHGSELGALGLRSLLPLPGATAARVLGWLERTRAASLLSVQPPESDVDSDVVALRAVVHELRAARRERGDEPRELLARQRALEARIRRRSWTRAGPAGVAGPAEDVVAVPELRRLLDGQCLVEYATVDDRVVAVVVEPRRTRLVELGRLAAVTEEVDALHFALRRLLRGGRFVGQARAAAGDAIDALAAQLVRPLGVPADAPLVVVPTGPLVRVLWSPLRAGPTSVAPSATFWARSRRRAGTPGGGSVDGAAGGPAPSVVLVAGPGLPGAAEEVRALRAAYPSAAALAPPESTVEATVRLVQQADLAHLACHGRLRADNPLFSALELSDGPLTLYEMFARGVAPRRVVLAACDSGVERSYAGDELLGFVSATMARGSAGVVAPGVPLPDGACVALMTDLHAALGRGLTLAAALHEARADVDRDSPAQYVAWCGLTAYGAA